mmetsp:Transcript_53681/g.156461  ORF Transcript_53681/g.156461 Transcript_53681/m.156461 type:complete len:207 (+) Transcript_53681:256-876(+)
MGSEHKSLPMAAETLSLPTPGGSIAPHFSSRAPPKRGSAARSLKGLGPRPGSSSANSGETAVLWLREVILCAGMIQVTAMPSVPKRAQARPFGTAASLSGTSGGPCASACSGCGCGGCASLCRCCGRSLRSRKGPAKGCGSGCGGATSTSASMAERGTVFAKAASGCCWSSWMSPNCSPPLRTATGPSRMGAAAKSVPGTCCILRR